MKRFLSKSFFISATTAFLLFGHTLSYALAAPYGGNMGMQQNMMGDMPILPNGKVYVPLVGEMTPEEVNKMMQEVDSFVGSLSPKERDEFMNFAEDLAVDMINENPDALFPPQMPGVKKPDAAKPAAPATAPLPTKLPEVKHVAPKETDLQTSNVLAALDVLSTINIRASSLRQKIASDETITIIDPFDIDLRDLVSYLEIISQDKHVGHLLDEEFKTTYKNIKTLHDALVTYEPQVYVPDYSGLKKSDLTKRRISKEALRILAELFDNAFIKQRMLASLEKLIQKYDPEALKLKKDAEQAEAKAKGRKAPEIKSRQPMKAPYAPQTSYYGQPRHSPYGGYGSSGQRYSPSSYGRHGYPSARKSSASSPSKTDKPKPKEEQPKDPDAEKSYNKLEKEIKEVNRDIEEAFEEIEESTEDTKIQVNGSVPAYFKTAEDSDAQNAQQHRQQVDAFFANIKTKLFEINRKTQKFRDLITLRPDSERRRYIEEYEKMHFPELAKLIELYETTNRLGSGAFNQEKVKAHIRNAKIYQRQHKKLLDTIENLHKLKR